MVSSADAEVGGSGGGIPFSLVWASTKLLEALSSVSIAKLKCAVINCSTLIGGLNGCVILRCLKSYLHLIKL